MCESKEKFESDELSELFTSLAKVQGELDLASADSKNPFFKSYYASLASISKVIRSPLAKHGLSVIQRIQTHENSQMFLYTRLCHASGQWMESKMPINPPKNDIQAIGSYISYVRRYTLAAIVGVVVGEEDDDGEAAMVRNKIASEKPNVISENNAVELEKILDQVPSYKEIVMTFLAKKKYFKSL